MRPSRTATLRIFLPPQVRPTSGILHGPSGQPILRNHGTYSHRVRLRERFWICWDSIPKQFWIARQNCHQHKIKAGTRARQTCSSSKYPLHNPGLPQPPRSIQLVKPPPTSPQACGPTAKFFPNHLLFSRNMCVLWKRITLKR